MSEDSRQSLLSPSSGIFLAVMKWCGGPPCGRDTACSGCIKYTGIGRLLFEALVSLEIFLSLQRILTTAIVSYYLTLGTGEIIEVGKGVSVHLRLVDLGGMVM